MEKKIKVKREPKGWSLWIYPSPEEIGIPIHRRSDGKGKLQYHIPEERLKEYFTPSAVKRLIDLKKGDSLSLERADIIWKDFPEHWLNCNSL